MSLAAYRLVVVPVIFVVSGLVLAFVGVTGPIPNEDKALILTLGGGAVALIGAVILLLTWLRHRRTGSIGSDQPRPRTMVLVGVLWLIAAAVLAVLSGELVLPLLLAVIGLTGLVTALALRQP